MSETYFKFTEKNGRAAYAPSFSWPLPSGSKPGKWVTAHGPLEPCRNGLHLCRGEDLIHWLAPELYRVEYQGKLIVDENKVVVRSARLLERIETWNERTARLLAADCAERVLPLFEAQHPDDNRPREAIRAARAFTNAEISVRELAAAGDAAWAAARADLRDAASAAARAAARGAAGEASRAAALAAAGDAARAAAGGATRGTAWDAAWGAARAAAGGAERAWQTARLLEYIDGRVEGGLR